MNHTKNFKRRDGDATRKHLHVLIDDKAYRRLVKLTKQYNLTASLLVQQMILGSA